LAGDSTLVEVVGICGYAPQRLRQFRLDEALSSPGIAEIAFEVSLLAKIFDPFLDQFGESGVNYKTLFSQGDGGLQQTLPGQTAVASMRRLHTANSTRNSRCPAANDCAVLNDLPGIVQVHVPTCGSGCALAEIQKCGFAVHVAHHKAAGTDITRFRECDCQAEGCRNGSIDGVSSG
jgi:hypothetical protein